MKTKFFTPTTDRSQNIETANLLLNELGVTAYFSGYSDAHGVSVYFHAENGTKIRISTHSVTSLERVNNEICLYFDKKCLGLGGKISFKSNMTINKHMIENYL